MRQDDEVLKGVLEAMKQGLVNQEQAKWLLAHQMSNQSQETLDQFDEEALVIMPTWARTTPYTLQYIRSLQEAVVTVEAKLDVKHKAHLSDFRMPLKNHLMLGAVVCLTTNIVAEANICIGAIGTIEEIICSDPRGPNAP